VEVKLSKYLIEARDEFASNIFAEMIEVIAYDQGFNKACELILSDILPVLEELSKDKAGTFEGILDMRQPQMEVYRLKDKMQKLIAKYKVSE
jgi:hypothetical protein